MEALVIFRSSDTGYTASDVTLTCKTVANPSVAVDTTGFTFYHLMTGIYLLTIPLATEESLFSIYVTSVPTTKFEGTMAPGDLSLSVPDSYPVGSMGYAIGNTYGSIDALISAVGQLLAGTYKAGVVSIPSATVTGQTLVLYEDANSDDMQFSLGLYWSTFLQDPDTQVWFTIKQNSRVTPIVDVQGSIFSASEGICRVSVTADQMNVTPGEYFWQLQVRKSTTTGNPPVTTVERRIALEGRVTIKPTYKQ